MVLLSFVVSAGAVLSAQPLPYQLVDELSRTANPEDAVRLVRVLTDIPSEVWLYPKDQMYEVLRRFEDRGVSEAAVRSLHARSGARELAVALTMDRDPRIRAHIMDGITSLPICEPLLMSAATDLLSDEADATRAGAANYFRACRSELREQPKALSRLEWILDDSSPTVRIAAAGALAELGASSIFALGALAVCGTDESSTPEARGTCLAAIVRIARDAVSSSRRDALSQLQNVRRTLRGLQDPYTEACLAAVRSAIRDLGGSDFDYLGPVLAMAALIAGVTGVLISLAVFPEPSLVRWFGWCGPERVSKAAAWARALAGRIVPGRV